MPNNNEQRRHQGPRTHVRVQRSDNREWPSVAVAYRELLGTAQELSLGEAQRMRVAIRSNGMAMDRHGFTWRALGGLVAEESINWTDFTFGVELEVVAPVDMYMVQQRVPSTWRVVRDGSLQAQPGFAAMEVVSPVLQGTEGLASLKQVMDMLREMGCRVNSTCGMHVHVGVRGMAPARVRKIAVAFLNAEHHFDALVPTSRRNNRYCQSNIRRVQSYQHAQLVGATTIRSLADVMNGGNSPQHYNPYRYYKLNFQSFVHHGTIEFRQHAGTVESDKALAWVRLLTGFCARAAAQAQQEVGAREGFEQWLAACTDEAGQRYMTARRAKFAAAAVAA
jgi:hypothetical protein